MLLIRNQPLVNESARGYILRVSENNGLETPRWLLSFLGEKSISSIGYEALTLILHNTEHSLTRLRGPIANLSQLNAADMGNIPMRYWNTRKPRYCPCCLAESPNWRASWDLVFTVACHKHGLRMQERCPHCQKILSWDRPHLLRCSCGFDLREAVSETASTNAVLLALQIELRLQSEARPPVEKGQRVWRSLHLESLLKLIWFFGAYSRHAHRKPQKIVGLETMDVALDMVELAMSALSDWPAGFQRLLNDIASRHSVASSGNKLSASFGSFYRALFTTFSGSEYDFLRAGFEGYVREHWSGQLAGRNRRLSTSLRSEHEWISIAEAVRLLKMRKEKIKTLIEEGVLVGQLYETKVGRKMSAIRRESLQVFASRQQELINLKEVRNILGLSRRQAYALLEKGTLNPISGPALDGQAIWKFQRQDILGIRQKRCS